MRHLTRYRRRAVGVPLAGFPSEKTWIFCGVFTPYHPVSLEPLCAVQ